MKKALVAIALVVVGVAGWYGISHRVAIKERLFTKNANVPYAFNRNEVVRPLNDNAPATNASANVNSAVAPAVPAPLPKEFNLKVPFTTQAPDANWDADHEEFCEEASALMVARYWQDRPITGTADAEQALQQIKKWEVDTFGYFKDTTAEEVARALREFYEFADVEVLYDPAVTDIKREVAAGHPVIVPAAGRELGNPNFKQPGPLYHMLVVKGYTSDGRFITNDPGTRKGADYVYDADVIMNAMHDWNGGDVANGQKAIIVVRGATP